MANVRKIYVEPGEMIEVRFVGPDFEKNARGWKEQLHPRSCLVRFFDAARVGFSNPATSVVSFMSNPKE